ncbi:ketopantoate reductase [Nadsonia fulvescens var. elongata DSM 6958]|uniref:2-dehydropantoate 2-reductase n=1 Tax=Nadsonia fulvescens var. elongata DSM 6958 TaxID=857566 RepID=A0A1E3PL01_9ASCO|nr:ketopantoate reductase [Nadsonia fulvescens var. elongata DSM 6958]
MKSVLLIGTGGVGTIAGLSLTLGGQANVTAVVRSAYDRVICEGYKISSPDHGNHSGWRPYRVVRTIDEAVNSETPVVYDYVVVSLKALPDVYCIEEMITPAVKLSHTTIVLIQNGIGIEEPLKKAYPYNVVLSGVSMIGCQNVGAVVSQFEKDRLIVGAFLPESAPEATNQSAHAIAKEFTEIYGTQFAEYTENITFYRWRKLVYNATINPICALTLLDTGRCHLSGLSKNLTFPAMQEVIAIAAAHNHIFPDDIADSMLSSDDGLYYRPSMMLDVVYNRPFELEAILGNTIKAAQSKGISCPTLSLLYTLLKGVLWRVKETQGMVQAPEEGVKWAAYS